VTEGIFQLKDGPYVSKKVCTWLNFFLHVFKILVIYFAFKNHPFFALEF
jgi:hypothetical protein